MAAYETYDRQELYQRKLKEFTEFEVPPCPRCGAANTASVQVGVIWVTIMLAATCPKFKLIPNGPKPGNWFCNSCSRFFDVAYEGDEGGRA
jgi:hypothetical protein